jgi:hypothetical protein
MQALPMPERGSSITELRQHVNVATDADFQLLVAAQVSYYRARGPYPVLVFAGQQGTAKSTNTAVLRLLIDPNAALLRSEPKEPRDLMIAANNGWLITLNNLSRLPDWLSDALCRLATGGGFSTRELYSDSDEVIFDAQRPAILNGIEELATRGDLLDRSIVLDLPRIAEDERLTEEDFYQRFYQARPRILGALLDGVSGALRHIDSVKLDKLPRMADFAKWAVAAEVDLGWQPGSFMAAYAENREAAHDLALEWSPIAAIIKEHLGLPFEGTATALLPALENLTDEKTRKLKSWPQSPRSLTNHLRRLAPNLAAAGIGVDFIRDKKKGRRRLIRIIKTESGGETASVSSASSANSGKQAKSGTFQPDAADDVANDNLNVSSASSAHRMVADGAEPRADDIGRYDDNYRQPKSAGPIRISDGADAADDIFPVFSVSAQKSHSASPQRCPKRLDRLCEDPKECDDIGCRYIRYREPDQSEALAIANPPETEEERAENDRLAAADADPGLDEVMVADLEDSEDAPT